MVSGNGISPLCPFIDSLDTSYTVGYKDVGVEYLTFCWRRFSGDCLWIYCQSRMALVFLVSFYYSLGGCSRFVVCFARYASLGRSSGAQLKTGAEEKEDTSAEFKQFVRKNVFGNPAIWVLAIANFLCISCAMLYLTGDRLFWENGREFLFIMQVGWWQPLKYPEL